LEQYMKKAIVALAIAGGLILTGCSSDSDEATTTEESAVEVVESAEASEEAAAETASGDIVTVATEGGFSTLVAAVQAAGLVETLQGEGPFTVLAPTDEAFAALPAGVLDKLLLPENKDLLAKILTYHVIPGKVMAADVTDGDVATVEGQNVTFSTADGVSVNGAKVITADVEASNGVVHVIDVVLVPADVDVSTL
jgi:uncharacterized surface protein with fasciclin (FAS1) repeats